MIKLLERVKEKISPSVPSIGLDIGSSSVKLAVVEKKGNERLLKKLSSLTLTPGTNTADALKDFIDTQGLIGRAVNTSLAGPSVVMRYVAFPRMTPAELKATMQFEAKQYIPFPLEQMIVDCAILKEALDTTKMLVVLAAIKKTAAEERLSLLQNAGLAVNLIDVDCFCLANAFMYNCLTRKEKPASKTTSLLNIGSRYTNMAIIDDGLLRFSRDIAFGGQEHMLQGLCAEINSSIDYYENQTSKPVEKVCLSGGFSLNTNTVNFLTRQMSVPVENFEVFSGVARDGSFTPQGDKPPESLFAVALGLALR